MSGWIFLFIRILLAITLYAFLGICLYLIWQSMKKHALLIPDERVPALTLSMPGTQDKIIQQDQTVGILYETTGIKIIADIDLSTSNAIISYKNTRWWINPVSSTPHIFLNDARINSPTILTDGDSIRFDESVITVLGTHSANNKNDHVTEGDNRSI